MALLQKNLIEKALAGLGTKATEVATAVKEFLETAPDEATASADGEILIARDGTSNLEDTSLKEPGDMKKHLLAIVDTDHGQEGGRAFLFLDENRYAVLLIAFNRSVLNVYHEAESGTSKFGHREQIGAEEAKRCVLPFVAGQDSKIGGLSYDEPMDALNVTAKSFSVNSEKASFEGDAMFHGDVNMFGYVNVPFYEYTGTIEDDAGQHGTWTMRGYYIHHNGERPIFHGYAYVSVTSAVTDASELRFVSSSPLDENIAICNFYLAYPGLGFRAYSARLDADHVTIRLLPDAGSTISLTAFDGLSFMVTGIPAN